MSDVRRWVRSGVSAQAALGCALALLAACGGDAPQPSSDMTSLDMSEDMTPVLCAEDERVVGNACVACPAGTTNAAGDDASGVDTTCDAVLCGADERVVSNACIACPPGATNAVGDDASGAETTCDATLCGVDEHVVANTCAPCPAGSTNVASDDASGANTMCDPTLCAEGEHVVNHRCVACSMGMPNAAGDDASGADTICNAPVVQLSVGWTHSCVVLSDGTARCWGLNTYGQLGDGTTVDSNTPVVVQGLNGVRLIQSGTEHTCAVLVHGTARCWGRNDKGQIGDGTTLSRSLPTPVQDLSGVRTLGAGYAFSCALVEDGTARCWGRNDRSQLGNGTSGLNYLTPVTVQGLSDIHQLSVGFDRSCALRLDGAAYCWGNNPFGVLGDGTTITRSIPVRVQKLAPITAMTVKGHAFSCVVVEGGVVHCWGNGRSGQLGDGMMASTLSPTMVQGLSDERVTSISTGFLHSCVRLADGTARCWGYNNSGRLGDGTSTDRLTPVVVQGLTEVIAVEAGQQHSCALRGDGTVWCWGNNSLGGLGDGTTVDSATPVVVQGL